MASVNNIGFRPLSAIKNAVFKPGPQMREVKFGLLKDINLQIDFKSQTQVYFGLYETETFAFTRVAAARADWLVDIGAGAGELALYFMKLHGAHTVHAFEPLQGQRDVFAGNLVANGWKPSDVSLSDKFVGAGVGSVALDAMGLDLGKRGFVKIDVDGAEIDVLNSGPELLRSGAADFLVEVHSKELEEQCLERFKAHGYKVDIIPNAWWRAMVPERRPVDHNRWLSAVPR